MYFTQGHYTMCATLPILKITYIFSRRLDTNMSCHRKPCHSGFRRSIWSIRKRWVVTQLYLYIWVGNVCAAYSNKGLCILNLRSRIKFMVDNCGLTYIMLQYLLATRPPFVSRGPFDKHGLTLILAWISNYIHYNVCEITYPLPNFNGITVEVWNGCAISSHTLLARWLLIHAGIKIKPC